MNCPLLLTTALVLVASAAAPMARAQAPKKPTTVAASLDRLKGIRAHLALLRAQPLAVPPAVVRVPQAVPSRPWTGSPSAFTAVYAGRGEGG